MPPKGDVRTLQGLSGFQSAFTKSNDQGHLPLHAAAMQARSDILMAVLQGEEAGTVCNKIPLLVIHHSNNAVSVAAMAPSDLTLEEKTVDGDTALVLAAEAGSADNVRILLEHGASPHNTNSRNESPLLIGRKTQNSICRNHDWILATH